MTQQNSASAVACPSCNKPGGTAGVLKDSTGRWQQCPNCNGTGTKSAAVIRVPFDYAFPTAVLTADQQGLQVVLPFDYDADFEHIWTVASATGIFSVQLQDRSTNRTLSNAPINGENYAGTAALPFPLVEPYVWARVGSALATFADRSDADNSVQLVFRGYKLYPGNAPQQGSPGLIVNAGT